MFSYIDGETATPTDDIQTWLLCANIDKPYTTLSEVLADNTVGLALINSDNAVKYMKRSTTWASDICADATMMSYIGSNDDCIESLLDDSTWRNALCNSTYFEAILTCKVPTMTDINVPSGRVVYSSVMQPYSAWKAFGNLNNTAENNWAASGNGANTGYLGYYFNNQNVKVYKVTMQNRNESSPRAPQNFLIQGSNDGTTWIDISTTLTNPNNNQKADSSYNINPSVAYKYIRLFMKTVYDGSYYGIGKLQFYCRTSS